MCDVHLILSLKSGGREPQRRRVVANGKKNDFLLFLMISFVFLFKAKVGGIHPPHPLADGSDRFDDMYATHSTTLAKAAPNNNYLASSPPSPK